MVGLLLASTGLWIGAARATASTTVSSSITANMTWTAAGSPYVLTTSPKVSAGVTLTIQPGVTVEFDAGTTAQLIVNGTIKALGTAASPVTFTSYQDASGGGAPGQYWGISIGTGSSASQFSYVNVRYGAWGSGGYYSNGALKVSQGASVEIDHSDFEHNQYSGLELAAKTATASVSDSTFDNNGDGISVLDGVLTLTKSIVASNAQDGIFFNQLGDQPASSITESDIDQNGKHGIDLQESCSDAVSTFPHGERNNIYGNNPTSASGGGLQLFTLYVCKALPVDWKNNYWGPALIKGWEGYSPCKQDGITEINYVGGFSQLAGWLANVSKRSGDSATSYTPGPISTTTGASYQLPGGPDACNRVPFWVPVYNAFAIVPGDVQAALMPDHVPAPTATDLYGNSSAEADGGSEASPNLAKPSCGDPVECATGNYTETDTDIAIPGLNGGLSFTRTYNSQAAVSRPPGPLGYGWSYRFGDSLSVDPNSGNAVVIGAAGNTVRFYINADGSYWAPPWVQATLTHNADGSYKYALPDHRSECFDASGRLIWEQDANGNMTALSYTGTQLSTVTDPSGRTLTFSYNTSGEISQITDPANRTLEYGYDGSGNLTTVTDVGNKVTGYGYDGSHQLTTITLPRGGSIQNTYDATGRVIKQIDPDGGQTTWSYGTNETTISDPSGVVTDETFGEDLLPRTITKGYGDADASTTKLAYDGDLNVTSVTDGDQHEWDYGYDGADNLTSVTDPVGHQTIRTFDAARNLTSITLPSGEETVFGYDGNDNLTSMQRTLAQTGQVATTTMTYNGLGELTALTDPDGHQWQYGYDSDGDRTSATSPLGHETTWGYDQLGGQTSVTTARGNEPGANPADDTTTILLDSYERPHIVTDPAGHTTTYLYDDDGNLTDVTDRDGDHTHIDYTLADRAFQVTRGDGTVIETAYWPNGTVKSQTNGANHATTYAYDPEGRLQSVTDPLNRATSYGYDLGGNLTLITDANGDTVTLGYNRANQLTSQSYSTGNPGPSSYIYTADGLPASISDDTGTTSYSYDSFDRLTSQTSGARQTTGYGYDLAGQLTSITYPDALTPVAPDGSQQQIPTGTISRGYDDDGNLTSVTDWLSNTTNFGYDPEGHLTSVTRPNGTSASYSYNPDGVLTDLTDLGEHTSITPTNNGLIQTITPPAGPAQAFSYDGVQRLNSGAYRDSSADDLTQTSIAGGPTITQAFDAANELQSTSQAGLTTNTFGYDQLGDRTSLTPANNSNPTTYSYNQAGELIGYQGPDHTSSGATVADTFTYDTSGLRQTKTSNNQLTNEVWDLADGLPLMIEDGPKAYITGPAGLPIEQIAQDGTVSYYSHDQQGSTTALSDDAGNTTATYSYDPYGNPIASTGPSTPFGYAGQYTDLETGLQYDHARYYDPSTGQFLTRDPAVASTREAYAYADNDPTNLSDPTGLDGLLGTGIGPDVSLSDIGNGLAGAAAGVTGGLSTALLNDVGVTPDTCSDWYTGGEVAGIIGATVAGGTVLARAAEETGSLLPRIAGGAPNSNPFAGPIDNAVNVVTSRGDVFDLRAGESMTGSPDSKWLQVRDSNGDPTGVRLDNGHTSHSDPRAQGPHIHVPGITNPDGTPWLPAN